MEERFALLVAQGRMPTHAYRSVWGRVKRADVQSCIVMKRPRVAARVAELQRTIAERAISQAVLSARERRELLAKTARSVAPEARATHGERIRALELDARITGELVPQVQVSGEVNVRACILAMQGGTYAPPAPTPDDLDTPNAQETSAEPAPVEVAVTRREAPGAAPGPALPVLGLVLPPVLEEAAVFEAEIAED